MNQFRHAVHGWRLKLIGCFFLIVLAILIGRLIWLQIIETGSLRDIGDEITIRNEVIPAYRGMITDRNGQPLAISTPVGVVSVRPKSLKDKRWADSLAPFLKTTPERLLDRVKKTRLPFIHLSRYVTPETAKIIENLNIEGVEISHQFRRFYPAGEVTSHVVGFTNIKDAGQEGLEHTFDDWLTGEDGRRHVLKNRRANVVRYVSAGEEVQEGKELRLSIDLMLQYLTYRALKEAVTQTKAAGGSAILVDGWTGQILALAGQPAFNPNDMASRIPSRIRNRPVTDLMEPGSSLKPFTVATALDIGVVDETTQIDTSPGRLRIQNHTVNDAKNFGVIDIREVIVKSSNVATSKIALMMEPTVLRDRLADLGLGRSTGSGFLGEAEGYLPSSLTLSVTDQAALSYGYALNVTLLQLVQAYSVFANKGVMQPLTILAGGTKHPSVRIFNEETVIEVLPMLRAVTEEGGTAKHAQISTNHVGGKTGTTMKLSINGLYTSRKYVSSFVGLAPISNPRFVMAISIDDPQSQQYFGGQVAAPVFADVMDDVMRIYNLPPDKTNFAMLPGDS